jgi:hypothetical protein
MPTRGNGVTFKWIAGVLISTMLMGAGWLHYQAWGAINHNLAVISALDNAVQKHETVINVQQESIGNMKREMIELRVKQDEALRILIREFGK